MKAREYGFLGGFFGWDKGGLRVGGEGERGMGGGEGD